MVLPLSLLNVTHLIMNIEPAIENAFGFVADSEQPAFIAPRHQDLILHSPKSVELAQLLDDLVKQHFSDMVPCIHGENREKLERFETHYLPDPDYGIPVEEDLQRCALRDVWHKWWTELPSTLLEGDGHDLDRLYVLIKSPLGRPCEPNYVPRILDGLELIMGTRHSAQINNGSKLTDVVKWLQRMFPDQDRSTFLLQTAEHSLAIGSSDIGDVWVSWLKHAADIILAKWNHASADHLHRLWNLLKWTDAQDCHHTQMLHWHMYRLHDLGIATESEVAWYLLGPPSVRTSNPYSGPFGDFSIALHAINHFDGLPTQDVLIRAANQIAKLALSAKSKDKLLQKVFGECHACFGGELLIMAMQVHSKLVAGNAAVAKKVIERVRPVNEDDKASIFHRLQNLSLAPETLYFAAKHAQAWSDVFKDMKVDESIVQPLKTVLSLCYFRGPAEHLYGYVQARQCDLCDRFGDSAIEIPAGFLQKSLVRISSIGEGDPFANKTLGKDDLTICTGCLGQRRVAFRHSTETGAGITLQELSRLFPSISVERLEDFRVTPEFNANQEPFWLTHCNDFMDYIGTWGRDNFEQEAAKQAIKPHVLFNRIAVRTEFDDERPSWSKWNSGEEFYLFECRHCRQKHGYLQAD